MEKERERERTARLRLTQSTWVQYLLAYLQPVTLSLSLQLTSLPTASLTAPHLQSSLVRSLTLSIAGAARLGSVKYSRGDLTLSTINKKKEKWKNINILLITRLYLVSSHNVIASIDFIIIIRFSDAHVCFVDWPLFQDYDAQDLLDFEETILRGCDFNRDGKISKKELTMILLALSKHSQDDETKSKQKHQQQNNTHDGRDSKTRKVPNVQNIMMTMKKKEMSPIHECPPKESSPTTGIALLKMKKKKKMKRKEELFSCWPKKSVAA